jgi:hypothetical protein
MCLRSVGHGTKAGSKLLPALLVLLAVSQAALPKSAEQVVTAYVEGDKTAVIAFLPPSMQDSQVEGAAEAQERVRSAIESAKLCLGDDTVSYRMVFVDRIVVRSLGREETFEISDFAPLVGALLVRPDSTPRILFAGGGPEALARMLRSAESQYFGKRCSA